jgi:hypothetical protein
MQLDFFRAAHNPTHRAAPAAAALPMTTPAAQAPNSPPSTLADALRGLGGWTCDPVPPPDKRTQEQRGEVEAWLLSGVMQRLGERAWMTQAVAQRQALEPGQRALVARLSRMQAEDGARSWWLAFGAVSKVRAALLGRSAWGVLPLASWTWGEDGGRGQEDARACEAVSALLMERGEVTAALGQGRALASMVRAAARGW